MGGGLWEVIEGLQIDVTCGLQRPGRCSKPINVLWSDHQIPKDIAKVSDRFTHHLNSPSFCNDHFWVLFGLCWRVASFPVTLMDNLGGCFFLWHYWLPMCARSRPLSFSRVCIKQMLDGISRWRVVCHRDGKLIHALLPGPLDNVMSWSLCRGFRNSKERNKLINQAFYAVI